MGTQRPHPLEEADPADRRQHRDLRLHQPGADRPGRPHPRRTRAGRGGEAARDGGGPVPASRGHERGAEAGLRAGGQQARAQRRLGRGPARRGARGAHGDGSRFRHRGHRLLDPRDRLPDRGPGAGGARRSGRRPSARGRRCRRALPGGRRLAAGAAPAGLRGRARPGRHRSC